MHHVRVTASLAAIRNTLTDLRWVTFKGPVLSELLHPVAGLRSYGDLDVLVDPMDLREASERLLGTGWQILATRDDLLNGEVTGELELGRAGGAVVDLHWSLVLSETLRRRFHVPTAELLARSSPVTIGSVEVRTFDGTDTLVHLCHHAAFSGAVRLVHLLDVDQAAARIRVGRGCPAGSVLGRRRTGRPGARAGPARPRHAGAGGPGQPARPLPRLRDARVPRWTAPAPPPPYAPMPRGHDWWRVRRGPAWVATVLGTLRTAVLGAVNRLAPPLCWEQLPPVRA